MIEKEFRIKPWWKVPKMFHNLIISISAPITGIMVVWMSVQGIPFIVWFWITFAVFIFMFLLSSTHCFGILLTTDELILQNGMFPFWRKRVAYASLEKVICWGQKEKTHPCIVVYKKGYKGFHVFTSRCFGFTGIISRHRWIRQEIISIYSLCQIFQK